MMSVKRSGELAEDLLNDILSEEDLKEDELSVETAARDLVLSNESEELAVEQGPVDLLGLEDVTQVKVSEDSSTVSNDLFEENNSDLKENFVDELQSSNSQQSDPKFEENDKTNSICDDKILNSEASDIDQIKKGSNSLLSKISASAEDFTFTANRRIFSGPISSTEAALANSQNLGIAQDKILELEKEIERLRIHNEQLATAGETFQQRYDELSEKVSNSGLEREEKVTDLTNEKKQFLKSIEEQSRSIDKLVAEKKQLEARVIINIKKVGVRERELENRLELVKMEKSAMSIAKDEIALDLKRKLDGAHVDLEAFKAENEQLSKKFEDQKDALKRAVKALKLALSALSKEGKVNVSSPIKKVD